MDDKSDTSSNNPSSNSTKTWKVRPIFISSTFKDFGAERNCLRNFVFPELMERIHERMHHLEPIDLRWGIETKTVADEEEKQLLILKVCFGEIQRSHPFLIALIGDRYGWIPPIERVKKAAAEIKYEEDIENKSVTALEIEYGVLNDKKQKKRSRFYFREALPYAKMPPEVAAIYSDEYSKEENAAIAIEQHKKLKDRIKDPIESPELVGRWRTYKAGWDATNNKVTELDEFGKMVLEDLWEDIKAETEEYFREPAPTWMEQERRTLSEFVEGRIRSFKGRVETIDKLLQFATSANKENNLLGYCLTGTAGSGKSAVFAKLYTELEKKDLWLLVNAAGPGAKSTDVDSLLERWIGELCANLCLKNPLSIKEEKTERELLGDDKNKPNRSEELENTFRILLYQASEQKRVVVLLDALDQMEQTNRSRYLNWLPTTWPENARLIATAIPGTQTESFAKRERMQLLELPPLEQKTAEEIVKEICNKYHRELNAEVLDIILKKVNDGVAALSNPLWLSMAIEELNLIDSDDFAYAEKEYEGDSESKLFQLLLDKATNMPAGIEELYQWIFKRLEKVFGKPFVKACLCFIAVGRKGWGERELEVLVPELTKEKWAALNWAAMRRLLRAHLVQSDMGLWRFFHAQMGRSIHSYYLPDRKEEETFHRLLSIYLLSLPETNLLRFETMYHLISSRHIDIAADYYSINLESREMEEATATIARYIMVGNDEVDTTPRIGYILSMLDVKDMELDVWARIMNRFQFDVSTLIEVQLSLASRLFYWEGLLNRNKLIALNAKGNADWQLSLSHIKIGEIQQAQGDLIDALKSYESSLRIRDKLAKNDPGNILLQGSLSVPYERIGNIQELLGNLTAAMNSHESSLRIREMLAENDLDIDWYHDLCASYCHIGDIQRAQGNLVDALKSYEFSRNTMERLAKSNADNTKLQNGLSITYDSIGDIQHKQGHLDDALNSFNSALKIKEGLAKNDPRNVVWQLNLSISYENIGFIKHMQGDLVAALNSYGYSFNIRERLAKSDLSNADWHRNLAVSYNMIGNIKQEQGDLTAALNSYGISLKIREQLAKSEPGNTLMQRDLTLSYDKIGKIQEKLGNLTAALNFYEISLKIIEQLANNDPSNTEWQRDLTNCYENIGAIKLAQGDLTTALSSFKLSLKISEQLANTDPSNTLCQRDLYVSNVNIGEIQMIQGDLTAALNSYKLSLKISEQLANTDTSNTIWQRDLFTAHYKITNLCIKMGDPKEARHYCERAFDAAHEFHRRFPENPDFNQMLQAVYKLVADMKSNM